MTRASWIVCLFVLTLIGCGDDAGVPGDAGRCSFETCAGCCDGDRCVVGTSTGACGTRGAACSTCANDEACTLGQCVPTADCSDCDGCCLNGTQCLPGNSPDACGRGGAACAACADGQACDVDQGTCAANTCDTSTCPNGCCTANGVCLTYGEQTTAVCGRAGAACGTCAASASACTQGTCVVDQPCLAVCDDGCCTAQGQCIPYASQSANTCGGDTGPELCGACGAGLACVAGGCSADQAWRVTVVSAVIAATNAMGGAWDQTIFTNPLPDPYIGIALIGDTFLDGFTPTIDNTLTPNWNHSFGNYKQSDLVNKGLLVNVRDSDGLGVFESIGACNVTITAQHLAAGSVTAATCGRASNVVIAFTAP